MFVIRHFDPETKKYFFLVHPGRWTDHQECALLFPSMMSALYFSMEFVSDEPCDIVSVDSEEVIK